MTHRVALDRHIALAIDQAWRPKPWKIMPAVSTLSAVVAEAETRRRDPPFWQASAALRKASYVQASALAGAPAGYMACTSMPASSFIRSMPRARPLDLAADRVAGYWGWRAIAVELAEILAGAIDRGHSA